MAVTNRQIICDVLLEKASKDSDIVVLCSDSRGSASLTEFTKQYPKQFVEVGIAEQNLVSIGAGLASCGKKAVVASPACFLSTRSYEQAKVDVAYSRNNVKLIGISGGVSYGALGMTHHSCQDIAAMAALPDMRVYLPSDCHQTRKLMEELLEDELPAYIRVSRGITEEVYNSQMSFKLNKANVVSEGTGATIISCGEMVPYAIKAANLLKEKGISVGVVDMYCLKPLDEEIIIKYAKETNLIVTLEEHSIYGGLGSLVAQIVCKNCPKQVLQLALPDEHLVAGTNSEIFKHYHLDEQGVADSIYRILQGAV